MRPMGLGLFLYRCTEDMRVFHECLTPLQKNLFLGNNSIMGFDPYRPFKKRKTDFIFVAAGLLMAVLLLLWAFLG